MNSTDARLSLRISALVAVCALYGCAGMSEPDCRGANWYEVGYRDARYKLQSQVDIYAAQCSRHGVQIDAARYDQGLRQGRFDFPDRMT
jgi:Protein of unknown function (DUF2799)